MFVYIPSLKLAANPVDALAAYFPAKNPVDNVPIAIINIINPYL